MAVVPNLTHGQSPTAGYLNVLFEELDRKTDLALDRHSILYLAGTEKATSVAGLRPFVGPQFVFAQGARRISGYWGPVYNHQAYTDAVAAGVFYTGSTVPKYDAAVKAARLNPFATAYFTAAGRTQGPTLQESFLLAYSLEAHRKLYTPAGGVEDWYWVIERLAGGAEHLQRVRRWDQAELIYEGVLGPIDIPPNWNKYNFFRIHNLNRVAITVRFRNSAGAVAASVEVEPYASRCIRRTGLNGDYTLGGRYFQKFLAGDPRFFQHESANNVVNPARLVPFVNYLLAGQPGWILPVAPTAFLDPHVRAPLGADRRAHFGDATAAGTIVGDLLHHRGEFLDVRTAPGHPEQTTVANVTFRSYLSIVADLAAAGITVTTAGDELRMQTAEAGVQHDFIALSTNLFTTPAGPFIAHPAINGSAAHTIDRTVPARSLMPVDVESTATPITFYAVNADGSRGALQTVTRTVRQLYFASAQVGAPSDLVTNRHTVADARNLVHFGSTLYAANQNTPWGAFTTASVSLTGEGLLLLTTQRVLPGRALRTGFTETALGIPNGNILTAGNLVLTQRGEQAAIVAEQTADAWELQIRRMVRIGGYGFPDTDNWWNTGFFPPGFTRTYCDRARAAGVALNHPDFYTRLTTGEDSVYRGDIAKNIATGIAVCSPWNGSSDYQLGIFSDDRTFLDIYGSNPGTLSNRDILYGAVNNVRTSGWWNQDVGGSAFPGWTNRTRCLANRIFFGVDTDGSDSSHFLGQPDAAGMYRYLRLPLLADHYNNLAAKVNSIVRVRPLNFIDHGLIMLGSDPDVRYRVTPNRTGIYERVAGTNWFGTQTVASQAIWRERWAQWPNLRPVNQFAWLLSSTGTEARVFQAIDVAVRTINDLPNGFAGKKGVKRRFRTLDIDMAYDITADAVSGRLAVGTVNSGFDHTVTLSKVRAVATPVTYVGEGTNDRPDLDALTEYFWVATEDVAAAAAVLGYTFYHNDCGRPLELLEVDLPDEAHDVVIPDVLTATVRERDTGATPGFAETPYGGQVTSHFDGSITTPARTLATQHPESQPFGEFHYVEFVDSGNPTWIATGDEHVLQALPADLYTLIPENLSTGAPLYLGNFRANYPDFTKTPYSPWAPPGYAPGIGVIALTLPRAFRAVNYWRGDSQGSARNPDGRADAGIERITSAVVGDHFAVIDYGPLVQKTRLLLTPMPLFSTPEDFSSTWPNALARKGDGTRVLPVTITPEPANPLATVGDPVHAHVTVFGAIAGSALKPTVWADQTREV